MADMADRVKAELGAVQETLFIPLAARARETRRRRPVLRDPKAALIAFDTYSQRTLEQQHKLAARKSMAARWAWSCDDPRTLESLGLEVVREAAATRPPPELRRRLPRRYRYALPLASRIAGDLATVTLFRADQDAGPTGAA